MKVKELIKLLKTVDKDREVAFTDGMPVEGIHGVTEDDALDDLFKGDGPRPVILSRYTLEQELENAQIEAEMWKGTCEQLKEEILATYPG